MKGFKSNNGNVKQLRPKSSDNPEDTKAELFRLRDEIARMVEKDPAKAASLLTQWLQNTANPQQNPQRIPKKKAG